jgi:hypothetical protein
MGGGGGGGGRRIRERRKENGLRSPEIGELCTKIFSKWLRFQVLTAASMKMAIFWIVGPCSLVEVYRLFSGTGCLHLESGGSKYI